MGATGRVDVETIVAQNSVEETMQQYERDALSHDTTTTTAAELSESKEYQVAKTHALLRSLRYITEFQSFRKASTKQKDDSTKEESPASRLESVNKNWKRALGATDGLDRPEKKRQRRVAFG
jgi:hypothetical protein